MIYLDHLSTTPVDPRVFSEMEPFFKEKFGNAASRTHQPGRDARQASDIARARVAALIGSLESEIVFTSGATESNNLAVLGVWRSLPPSKRKIVSTPIEHSSVLGPIRHLESVGAPVAWVKVDSQGLVDLKDLESKITQDTGLVSVIFANNEIGTIQPIHEIAEICRKKGTLFHADAAQAAGKLAINIQETPVDLLSLSAHKMYGPKGVGALFVRRKSPRIAIEPLLWGGGHEDGLRAGTPNVAGMVGMGKAAEIAKEHLIPESKRLWSLTERIGIGIQKLFPRAVVNGPKDAGRRLPHLLNVSLLGIPSQILMAEIKSCALSSGSACASGSGKPSHVLEAIGADEARMLSSIRIGVGRFTKDEEVDQFLELLKLNCLKLSG